MPSNALETLRLANQNLRSALLEFRPEQSDSAAVHTQQFSALLSDLMGAAECLQHSPASGEATEFAREAREYRHGLEKLKQLLPSLQLRLLAEKSRLEAAQDHLSSASAWDQLRKKTL